MKTIHKRLLLSIAIFMGVGIGITGAFYYQPNLLSNHPFLKELVEKLMKYQEDTQTEKVYLQFDKKFYEPDQDIWFSAYVRDAQTFQSSKKSSVVYVELLNPKGSVEQKLTLIAKKGKAAGEFHLDKALKGGLYKIKAYTQWQKNTNTIFERQITVQKSVLPNLNMKLNFDNKAYGAGANVTATLDLNTLTKEPLAHHVFNYVISIDGQTIKKVDSKTGADGRASVQFKLPKNLESNDGLLNVMLKYKGQTESISRSIPIVLGNIDLAFYPEGGDLIEGMICGMGFKALDEFGKPADIKGQIYDQNNKVVATLASYHQGMGKFELAPQQGAKYFAKITAPANITKIYELPTAVKKGYTVKINSQSKSAINLDVISTENEQLFVVAQSRNNILFSKDIEAQAGLNSINIPTKDFPIGISQITLFDSKKIARAERLVFVNTDKKLNIKVKTDKEKYQPREKVNMEIEVTDERGIPMPANLSLAVVDDKLLTFADDKQGHILSYMLLEADLQGKIEEPNFYFDDENDATRLKPEVDRQIALEHLLMTQGWRKFKWQEVIDGKYTVPNLAGELAVIAGSVRNIDSEKISGVTIELAETDQKVLTDKDGKFSINDFELFKSTMLNISADGYYPVNIPIADYSATLDIVLARARNINGLVLSDKKKRLGSSQIYIDGKYAATSNEKGEFSIKIPETTTSFYVYQGNYQPTYVEIPASGNTVKVIMKPYANDRTYAFGSRSKAVPSRRKENAVPPPPPPAPPVNAGVVDIDEVHVEDMEVENEAIEELKVDNNFNKPNVPGANKEEEKNEEILVDDLKVENPEPVVVAQEKNALEGKKAAAEQMKVRNEIEIQLRAEAVAKARKDIALGGQFLNQRVDIPAVETRYSRVREFPVIDYENNQTPDTRTDFRKTVYWNPNVEVGTDGKASLSFYNNDDITQFRVTAEGFSDAGGLGRVEYNFFTQLPFEMVTKVPREVLSGDLIKIPLTLTNNTSEKVAGKLTVEMPAHLQLTEAAPASIELAASKSKTIFLNCKVLNKIAEGKLTIAFNAKGISDKFVTTVVSNPRGFPVNEVFNGDQMTSDFELSLQEPIEGSIIARIQAYPSVLDEVMSGMESMLRMPSGCFEQTSSSNYPNLLVLDYMREANVSNPQLEKQVQGYLDAGYKRLVGYESNGGGFDWWGRNPAHEALSAYGLMQFVDMKAVYPVDQKLIDRTAKWLLSRKDGKGSWNKNPNALHSWATAEVTDAYIVWAISEAGYSNEIKKEIDKSYNDAIRSEDPYMLALIANTLFNVKDSRANMLVKELAKLQQKDGSFKGLTSSVTNSTGQSLMVETSSLCALAMMQTTGYTKQINSAIKAIQNGKSYYGYGSTQGTVLALKALLQNAKASKKSAEDGEILVLVNNKQVSKLAYKAGQKEIAIPNIAQYLKSGKQKVTIQYTNTKNALPVSLELTYNTRVPQSSAACKLSLQTTLPRNKVKMGETIRLTTTLTNTINEGQPMTMAMVGIPAGLSLQPWQLKELQEKKVFDYYELFEGYVVFHYEQMKANETKMIHLDLKADIPGDYEAPASSAFLYYTNEHKVWANPEKMSIN